MINIYDIENIDDRWDVDEIRISDYDEIQSDNDDYEPWDEEDDIEYTMKGI